VGNDRDLFDHAGGIAQSFNPHSAHLGYFPGPPGRRIRPSHPGARGPPVDERNSPDSRHRPDRQKPGQSEHLRTITAGLDPGRALDVRDRALMLVGFAGAFRRSELVGLIVEDLEFNDNGLVVHLRRSKTDPEEHGWKVGIPYGLAPATCPVRAVEAWVEVLPIADGPLFRAVDRHGRIHPTRLTAQSVALVVKKLMAKAGIPGDYAGHSLRAGLAPAAAAAGVPERAIMAQTGHRSLATLRKYIREGSLFLENAAAKVGL
jgi:integrase